MFEAQGPDAWKKAQAFYRANSRRWKEDKTAALDRSMKSVNITECEILANEARPINDADWGSDRQVEAEGRLFTFVKTVLSADEFERLEAFCLKATTEEQINQALLMVVTKGEAA